MPYTVPTPGELARNAWGRVAAWRAARAAREPPPRPTPPAAPARLQAAALFARPAADRVPLTDAQLTTPAAVRAVVRGERLPAPVPSPAPFPMSDTATARTVARAAERLTALTAENATLTQQVGALTAELTDLRTSTAAIDAEAAKLAQLLGDEPETPPPESGTPPSTLTA